MDYKMKMEISVFKFGGASVKDSAGVKNVADILTLFKDRKVLVVISAMGKTTNALEKLVHSYVKKTGNSGKILEEIKQYHLQIIEDLFGQNRETVLEKINNFFVEIEWILEELQEKPYNYIYDQMVAAGELISTTLVNEYLLENKFNTVWADARDLISTDDRYKDAKINFEKTTRQCHDVLPKLFSRNNLVVTQGFIGSSPENNTTTLGREGSDYTASILAYCMDASSVTIWKDVPGVLNADPKFFKEAQLLDQVSFQDAIELAYYGAGVIHPKTIQPIQAKNIPLFVKSFFNPTNPGTKIGPEITAGIQIPSFIIKENQVLLSIASKDFTFIAEEHLSHILGIFAQTRSSINMMQLSAISFSCVTDKEDEKTARLIQQLKIHYKVLFNKDIRLITIRHYNASIFDQLTEGHEILAEQRSRSTVQVAVKALE